MAANRAYRPAYEPIPRPEYAPPAAKVHKGKKTKPKSKAKFFFYILLSFAIGSLLVGRYVFLEGTGRELRAARAELAAIEIVNQQLQMQIDRNLDLSEIGYMANNYLGMRRVESHQRFYINMNTENFGERVSRNPDSNRILHGVPGILINAIETLR